MGKVKAKYEVGDTLSTYLRVKQGLTVMERQKKNRRRLLGLKLKRLLKKLFS